MDKKMELLKKLQALANDTRGNEEERKTSIKMLERLMKKYNISEEDLGKIEKKERWFWYSNPWECSLLHQIRYMLFGDGGESFYYRTGSKQRDIKGSNYMMMTDAEYLEFSYLYEVYRDALRKEMNIFYSAFVQKNRLFPPDNLKDDEVKSNEDCMSRSDLIRMSMMMEGIEHVQVRKAIGDGTNQDEK